MRETRQEILDTAKRLFNERGYNNVSTRDISGALEISKGNLTYYFKKKEEIIEAILAENLQTRMAEAPNTLVELNAFFEDIQKTVQENAFYFWHHAQLGQISPAIEKMQSEILNQNIALLTETLCSLNGQGIVADEQYQGEYSHVVNTLLLTSIYWMPFCKLKNALSETFAEQAWSLVYPYLTDTGVTELRTVVTFADKHKAPSIF